MKESFLHKIQKNYALILTLLGIFGFYSLFFSSISPITIFDLDEWTHNAIDRGAYPEFGKWNPARVLPEITLPTVTSLSAFILRPLVGGDYISAIVLGQSLFISGSITGFIAFTTDFVSKKYKLNIQSKTMLSIILAILPLLILKTDTVNNLSIFALDNSILFYFYTLPAMLNICIILKLSKINAKDLRGKFLGWIFLGIYLGIFSNLFTSIILAAWAGMNIAFNLFKKVKFSKFIKNNWLNLLILGLFLFSLIFELSGGRSQDFQEVSFKANLIPALKTAIKTIFSGNILALVFLTTGLLPIFQETLIRKKTPFKSTHFKLAIVAILVILGEILLGARIGVGKISNTQVSGIIFLMIFLPSIIGWGKIIAKNPLKINNFLPILILIMFFEANPLSSQTFRPINPPRVNGFTVQNISREMVQKTIEAEQQGLSKLTIEVPYFPNPNNYPLSTNSARFFSQILLKHNIITRPIEVEFKPNKDLNKKLLGQGF